MKLTSITRLHTLAMTLRYCYKDKFCSSSTAAESFANELETSIEEIKYRREQVISQQKTINRLMKIIEEKDERLAIQSPDVVRCKDCAYLGNSEKCIVQKYISEHPKIIWLLSLQAEWFCADGKPKGFID